jgi:hypothetical protein
VELSDLMKRSLADPKTRLASAANMSETFEFPLYLGQTDMSPAWDCQRDPKSRESHRFPLICLDTSAGFPLV